MGAVVVGCATRATRSWLEARRPASCASPVRWQQPALANELVRALLFVRIFLLSCVRFRELFFAAVVSSNGLCLALWPRACAACSSCRSGDAPPRYEQGAEQRFLFFAESQKPRRLPKIDFFLLILRIDFRLVFRDASLGG